MLGLLMLIGVSAEQEPVPLGTAANYVILSEAGITTTGTTAIVGNLGVSPINAAAITGFGLIEDASTQFSTSSLVTGKIYAADYAVPTPNDLNTAVSDMQAGFTDAAGRSIPDFSEYESGLIGGSTLIPGLYKWGTSVNIVSDVTFSGNSSDVWVLQIAGELILASGTKVILIDGASTDNIFWQVAGQTTLGTTSVLQGIVLCQVAIAMKTGATLIGRALAQTAVTLDSNSVASSTLLLPAIVRSPSPTEAPSTAPTETPSTAPSSPTKTPSTAPTETPSTAPSTKTPSTAIEANSAFTIVVANSAFAIVVAVAYHLL